MSEERPKDMSVALRQLIPASDCSVPFPVWFIRMGQEHGHGNCWKVMLTDVADELERMQQLNGRLIKRLAGD